MQHDEAIAHLLMIITFEFNTPSLYGAFQLMMLNETKTTLKGRNGTFLFMKNLDRVLRGTPV